MKKAQAREEYTCVHDQVYVRLFETCKDKAVFVTGLWRVPILAALLRLMSCLLCGLLARDTCLMSCLLCGLLARDTRLMSCLLCGLLARDHQLPVQEFSRETADTWMDQNQASIKSGNQSRSILTRRATS